MVDQRNLSIKKYGNDTEVADRIEVLRLKPVQFPLCSHLELTGIELELRGERTDV
jgi:hypothetical protein